jgi:methylmalonyl-CoA mutase N-terminal domain/subunit
VRVAIQTLAAVLGGTQSLHTNSRDEALNLPTEDSVQIALKTQQIVAHESGVTQTVDPLGGSYYIENLTDKIEAEVWQYLDKIEALGGMVQAIEQGYVQKEIQSAAYRYQQEIETGKRTVVGVNKFIIPEATPVSSQPVNPQLGKIQIEKLLKIKQQRDNVRVAAALKEFRQAVKERDKNLMPYILAAIKEYASLGEICNVLREEFGEYHESVIL